MPPAALRRVWPSAASRRCASTSPASARARAISPIPGSARTSRTSSPPSRTCARHGRAPAILIGHSLGGAAVLAAAGAIPEVRAVAVIAAPFDTSHTLKYFDEHVSEIEARGEAEVTLAGRRFTIRRSFLDDLRSQNQGQRIAQARQGADRLPFADGRHGRDRECADDLRGGPASQELHLARRRRSSADAARGCRLRGVDARRLGGALYRKRRRCHRYGAGERRRGHGRGDRAGRLPAARDGGVASLPCRRAGRERRARGRVPDPMTCCSPRSAPARR